MADDPQDQTRRLYEDAEKRTASAVEQIVQGNAFGELLARSTENVMGLTRIGFNTMDLVLRNLRVAGRGDVVRLGRQLARTEDKLERVLQEVEHIREDLKKERGGTNGRAVATSSRSSSSRSRSSQNGRKRSPTTRSKSS